MLSVILRRDPECLTRQACSVSTRWDRLRGYSVYSGPSLLAQITCPYEALPDNTLQAFAGNVAPDVLTEGLKMVDKGMYQFRTHPTLGCRGCPVRAYDDAPGRVYCRSTCGSIVDYTTEILRSLPERHLRDSVVLATVRLVGKGRLITVRDGTVRQLLTNAHCATLNRFEVE